MNDKYINKLQKYLINYLKKNKISNVVIGISGGIDSSVSLAIISNCLKSKNIFPYFIDIESKKIDYHDCLKLCEQLNLNLKYVNITKGYKKLVNDLKIKNNQQKANLKSRLRMSTLYNYAFENNAIVIGNSNLDELYLGYFTKHGDNACDLNLLGGLLKKDIIEYARIFKIPESIIEKKPTSGLINNLYDEEEIGVNYSIIDNYLSNKKIDNISKIKIEHLHQKNYHKLIYNMYRYKSTNYRKTTNEKNNK